MVTSEDYERLGKLMNDYVNSDEHKAFLIKHKTKKNLKLIRFRRFEKYLETHDFDRLIYRLILEHGQEWREKCHENGFEPYMNNKLKFLIDYVVNNAKSVEVKKIKTNFTNHIWEFKGYYFQMIWGQGVIIKIHNKEDLRELLSI